MSEKTKFLDDTMRKFFVGYAVSKAMLEDYADVVSKLEGTSKEEVEKRVRSRADEILQQMKDEANETAKN